MPATRGESERERFQRTGTHREFRVLSISPARRKRIYNTYTGREKNEQTERGFSLPVFSHCGARQVEHVVLFPRKARDDVGIRAAGGALIAQPATSRRRRRRVRALVGTAA